MIFYCLRQISHYTHLQIKLPVKCFKKINPYALDLHNKNRPLNSANFSLISEVILTFLIHTVSIFCTFLYIEEGASPTSQSVTQVLLSVFFHSKMFLVIIFDRSETNIFFSQNGIFDEG